MDWDREAIQKKPFLTVTEVGALLGCDEKTVYRIIERGKLPPPKAIGGGKKVFPHRMIVAWLIWREYAPDDVNEVIADIEREEAAEGGDEATLAARRPKK